MLILLSKKQKGLIQVSIDLFPSMEGNESLNLKQPLHFQKSPVCTGNLFLFLSLFGLNAQCSMRYGT